LLRTVTLDKLTFTFTRSSVPSSIMHSIYAEVVYQNAPGLVCFYSIAERESNCAYFVS